MNANAIAARVVEAFTKVHAALGPGLLKEAYQEALALELGRAALRVDRQVAVPVRYEGEAIGPGWVADLVVEGLVCVSFSKGGVGSGSEAEPMRRHLALGGWTVGCLIRPDAAGPKEGLVETVREAGSPGRLRPDARRGAERLTGQRPRV